MKGETTVRVRYAETDQAGVVYHSNFIIWFEVGRVELLRQMGFNYRQMEIEDDCTIAVADVRCRYRSPARYDDIVLIRTRLTKVKRKVLHFEYDLLRQSDGTLLAQGETIHVVVNAGFQSHPLPDKYFDAFRGATGLGI
ncbi:MAG: thioesterase family protein [Acidobacteriaceae bacterium]